MKKLITLFSLLPLAAASYAQISIASTDIPVADTFHCLDITATAAANPTVAPASTWNYSSDSSTSTFINAYTPETLSVFTAAGANVYLAGTKTLASGFVYYTNSELAFGTSAVQEVGINVPFQGYSLTPFTTGATDSIVIPSQQIVLSTPKPTMQFPMTAGSHWSSVTKRSVNFTVSVASASLNHTPGQHVYYIHRSDSIAGWGSLRVHTPSGPSKLYNVLVDKSYQYSTDSFYLSGAPAPTLLLSTFHVAQGQVTDTNYRYNFYRKGYYNYLLSFYYGGDNTYSSPEGKYVDTDGLQPANAGVGQIANEYTSVVFPNPATNNINVMFSGAAVTPKNYLITDMAGRTVQAGELSGKDNVHIVFGSSIATGNYILDIWDENSTRLVTERIAVSR